MGSPNGEFAQLRNLAQTHAASPSFAPSMPAVKLIVSLHGGNVAPKNLLLPMYQTMEAFLSSVRASVLAEQASDATEYEFIFPDLDDDEISMGPESFYQGVAPFLTESETSPEIRGNIKASFPMAEFDAMNRAKISAKIRVTQRKYCLDCRCYLLSLVLYIVGHWFSSSS